MAFSHKQDPLMNAESEWLAVFDAVSDALCLLDEHHVIQRCNKAMVELAGMPEKEILGKHCWEIVHGNDTIMPQCPVLIMEKTLKRESMELSVGDKWFQVTVDPILDEKGSLCRTVHIIRDCTQQKLTELESVKVADRFRAMIDTAPYGAHLYELATDGKLIVIGANSSGKPSRRRFLTSWGPKFPMLTEMSPFPESLSIPNKLLIRMIEALSAPLKYALSKQRPIK
jgi:PAS domain S-box-containing protein